MIEVALIEWLMVHTLEGRTVFINPKEIISLAPPGTENLFAKGVRCVVSLTDAKFVSVKETCDEVRKLLGK